MMKLLCKILEWASQENMERIFNDLEMFTTKGLLAKKELVWGLQYVKIIKSHGGDLFVDSHLGKGSTFYFQIPNNIIENIIITRSMS